MVVPAEEAGGLITSSARVLVATAVPVERDAVAEAFPGETEQVHLPGVSLVRMDGGFDLLATGVGPAAAAASTAAALTAAALDSTPYGLVVCAGIGGGFPPEAPLGSLVVSHTIVVADLGAETADGFLPVTELGFGHVAHRSPRSLVREAVRVTGARPGTVLTVSTATGTAGRAAALRARYPNALAEGMEGFGVAEAAVAQGRPVLEVRAVSNPVGPRDRAAWRIGDALSALTEGFGQLAPVLKSWIEADRDHHDHQ
ncbi:futalosine hydrolase [Streptomyces sp. NPDC093250]|uniref:futalosine hydrolase n=1 Tax=Streptomyces sp. NPDC093250 TaxID=3366036 RepID=UPI00382E7FFA